jgi:hypothetical protein
MPFPIPENHKFACIALEGPRVADDLPDSYRIAENVWAVKTAPVEVDDWWGRGLGTWELERYKRCGLFLFATMESAAPMILDREHQLLQKKVYALLHSLQIHEAARFEQGRLLVGARMGDQPVDLRQHSQVPACYPHSSAHQAVLNGALLGRAHDMAEQLLQLFGEAEEEAFPPASRVQQHSRVRRGFNVLLAGLRERYGNQRFHHFERALEAVTHPPIGKTRKKFVSRCTVFAGDDRETRSVLENIYDLRSAEEHLNEWQPVLAGHPDAEEVAALRSYQSEVLACYVYRRILGDAALRGEFATDATADAFWARVDPNPGQAWGATFDIREDALRRSRRLE